MRLRLLAFIVGFFIPKKLGGYDLNVLLTGMFEHTKLAEGVYLSWGRTDLDNDDDPVEQIRQEISQPYEEIRMLH